ncbi:MAG TPA: Fe-Mn family superoxide dismutase [Candidatus Nanoarchaeia archaeon]|nr:Fe-Mn family superoxide dismutase [Candidatus Nanoarchaeia archaeon]
MTYTAKDYSFLKGKVKGLSDKQLDAHFGLYQGYVKKWNEIQGKLATQDKSAANYSYGEFSELKRREAVAFNGTFLHELYFENLESKGSSSKELKKAVENAFGSWDNFVADIKASASSTPGWVLVTWNKKTEKLHTFILFEHHIGLPAHQEIILCLDCWEHAFMIDYGTDKASYLKVFLENINWDVVNKRFQDIKNK